MSLLFTSEDCRPESCALVRDALAMLLDAGGTAVVDERDLRERMRDGSAHIRIGSPMGPDLYEACNVLARWGLADREAPRPQARFVLTEFGRRVAHGEEPWPRPAEEPAPSRLVSSVTARDPARTGGASASPWRSGPRKYVGGEELDDPESYIEVTRVRA